MSEAETKSSSSASAVTASDSTVLDPVPRGLYVGGAGAVAVRFPGSATTVTFSGVPAGTVLPIKVEKVMATGTTATSIVALV